MTKKLPAAPGTPSTVRIVIYSFCAAFSVVIVAVSLQWIAYDDWLRESGPIRLVGTILAATATFGFILHWQFGLRERHRELVRRLELIAKINDRIRNQVQAIACLRYASDPAATDAIRVAVDQIDSALRGLVADTNPHTRPVSNSVDQQVANRDRSLTEPAEREYASRAASAPVRGES